MAGEEAVMEAQATNMDQMIRQLNEFIVPSTLMESFDAYREESVKASARNFSEAQLSWFLEMLNGFRGSDDRKDSLLDIFDPNMFTFDHPARSTAPGIEIEMPALTSDVAMLADRDSEFALFAKSEISEFRDRAGTYAEEEILGLAQLAASSLADQGRTFPGREEAIRYLALNASTLLEDLWATDDTLWKGAPARRIQFDDMVQMRKEDLLKVQSIQPPFEEADFTCYSEDEIRKFAFDIRSLLLASRAKHVAICTRCQTRLESWTKLVEKFDRSTPTHCQRADA
jgi:hypothetical protein